MQWLRTSAVRLLMVVATFGLITVETLLRLTGQTRSAAESWLRRMVRDGWLQSAPLDDHQVYYRLTAKAVLYLKRICKRRVSRAATRPLSANRKFEKYALLLHCTAVGSPQRSAYRPSHDAAAFSDIAAHIGQGKADPLRHKLFYREGEIIGYFVADRGQSRLIQSKVRPKMFSIFSWNSFQQLAESNRIRLTIATTTESRKRELVSEFEENPPPIAWEVVVIPELCSLLPRIRFQPSAQETSHGKTS
jgi:DNA-binding MarR family transcriptional regulator